MIGRTIANEMKNQMNQGKVISLMGARQTGKTTLIREMVSKENGVVWLNNWYYLDETGAMKVGQVTVNNRQYYLGSGGAMVTGWVTINGSYFYYDTTAGDNYGAMLINNWIKYDGKYFYFDENGIMVTGWNAAHDAIFIILLFFFIYGNE